MIVMKMPLKPRLFVREEFRDRGQSQGTFYRTGRENRFILVGNRLAGILAQQFIEPVPCQRRRF